MPSHRVTVAPAIMQKLRELLPGSPYAPRPGATQGDIARMLGVTRRTVGTWERDGSVEANGWALVGLAFRFGEGKAALRTLAQAGLPGSDVWGSR